MPLLKSNFPAPPLVMMNGVSCVKTCRILFIQERELFLMRRVACNFMEGMGSTSIVNDIRRSIRGHKTSG